LAGAGCRGAWAAQRPSDALQPLRVLLGEWDAIGTPPGERGGVTFSLPVPDHVVTRTKYAIYDARDGRPASRHDDLMVIYAEGDRLRADYFDNEGHVIRYRVTSSAPDVVVFVSEPAPQEPRYRLTYRAGAAGVLDGTFEVAGPDAPD